ncbi:MAG: VUT family protein [Aquabacterium sp.]|nr:VUT family protein [Aquabacterium sp.]
MKRPALTLALAIAAYAAAMLLANFAVAAFGPGVTGINAFLWIGLDLALRDWLHVRLRPWQMAALIVTTGVLTWVLNPAAGGIALASAIAFSLSSLADWAVFSRLRGSWLWRANGSNVAGAAVDSLVFPTLAFGSLMPGIVAMQFIAKVAGGAMWAWLLRRVLPVGAQASSPR